MTKRHFRNPKMKPEHQAPLTFQIVINRNKINKRKTWTELKIISKYPSERHFQPKVIRFFQFYWQGAIWGRATIVSRDRHGQERVPRAHWGQQSLPCRGSQTRSTFGLQRKSFSWNELILTFWSSPRRPGWWRFKQRQLSYDRGVAAQGWLNGFRPAMSAMQNFFFSAPHHFRSQVSLHLIVEWKLHVWSKNQPSRLHHVTTFFT